MWILTILLGLTVVIVGVLVSLGFMSGRELYEQKVIYKMETDASSTSIKVLDIDPCSSKNPFMQNYSTFNFYFLS